jgi:hypothetical protein
MIRACDEWQRLMMEAVPELKTDCAQPPRFRCNSGACRNHSLTAHRCQGLFSYDRFPGERDFFADNKKVLELRNPSAESNSSSFSERIVFQFVKSKLRWELDTKNNF